MIRLSIAVEWSLSFDEIPTLINYTDDVQLIVKRIDYAKCTFKHDS